MSKTATTPKGERLAEVAVLANLLPGWPTSLD